MAAMARVGGNTTDYTNGSTGGGKNAAATGTDARPTKSGVKYVSYVPHIKKWKVQASIDGVFTHGMDFPYKFLPLAIDFAAEIADLIKAELPAAREKYREIMRQVESGDMQYRPRHVLNEQERSVFDWLARYAPETDASSWLDVSAWVYPDETLADDEQEAIGEPSTNVTAKNFPVNEKTPYQQGVSRNKLYSLLEGAIAATDRAREIRGGLAAQQRAVEVAERQAAERWDEVALCVVNSLPQDATVGMSKLAALVEAVRNGH